MGRNGSAKIALAAGVALFLLARDASASDAIPTPDGGVPEEPNANVDEIVSSIASPYDAAAIEEAGINATESDPMSAIDAFLYMIRCCEHRQSDVDSSIDYQTVYGGGRFTDFSDHPAITKEWVGKRLPDNFCIRAGLRPPCKSTAAGAFQINVPTWREFRLRGTRLPDFSPESQNECARRILRHTGASDLILSGDIAGAIAAASRRWESLPGATGGQGGRTLAYALDRFNSAYA